MSSRHASPASVPHAPPSPTAAPSRAGRKTSRRPPASIVSTGPESSLYFPSPTLLSRHRRPAIPRGSPLRHHLLHHPLNSPCISGKSVTVFVPSLARAAASQKTPLFCTPPTRLPLGPPSAPSSSGSSLPAHLPRPTNPPRGRETPGFPPGVANERNSNNLKSAAESPFARKLLTKSSPSCGTRSFRSETPWIEVRCVSFSLFFYQTCATGFPPFFLLRFPEEFFPPRFLRWLLE